MCIRDSLGIGGIVIVVIIGLMFPSLRPILFGLFLGGDTGSEVQQSTPAPTRATSDSADPQVKFVRSILGSTEDVWGSTFQAGGKQYEQPKLVPVSYTHLRAHETPEHLVCRLLL